MNNKTPVFVPCSRCGKEYTNSTPYMVNGKYLMCVRCNFHIPYGGGITAYVARREMAETWNKYHSNNKPTPPEVEYVTVCFANGYGLKVEGDGIELHTDGSAEIVLRGETQAYFAPATFEWMAKGDYLEDVVISGDMTVDEERLREQLYKNMEEITKSPPVHS
jgi:hypothetical protein